MAQTTRKSLATVGLSIGGIVLEEGGGENDFVAVTSPERGGSKTGVHGDTVLFDIPGAIYEVTITLLETSSANRDLQELYNAQVTRETEGSLDFTLEDTATGELLTGQCIFTKEPDRGKTTEPGNYEWALHVATTTPWEYQDRSVIT